MTSRKTPEKRVRTPSQQRARRTVDAILTATALVLIERGYVRTTTNHIAERAGVSVASFYEYFANKEGAIAALLEGLVDKSVRLAAAWGDLNLTRPPHAALREATRRVVAALMADAPLIVALQQLPPGTLPRVEEIVSRVALVARSYAAGRDAAPAGEPSEDRLCFMALLAGSFLLRLVTDPQLAPRRAALVDQFIWALDCCRAGVLAERATGAASPRDPALRAPRGSRSPPTAMRPVR